MKREIPKYTTILHDVRLDFGLTLSEYCFLDIVSRLSHNVGFEWCQLRQKAIASQLGLTDRTVRNLIVSCEAKELLERNEIGQLRTTQKWEMSMVSRKELPTQEEKTSAPSIYTVKRHITSTEDKSSYDEKRDIFVKLYKELFHSKFGKDYKMAPAKDYSAIKRFITAKDGIPIYELITFFLNSEKGKEHPTITACLSAYNINKFNLRNK